MGKCYGYNRWGKLVYETSESKEREVSPAVSWDGTVMNSGNLVADGTYYYTLNLRDELTGKDENRSGTLKVSNTATGDMQKTIKQLLGGLCFLFNINRILTASSAQNLP